MAKLITVSGLRSEIVDDDDFIDNFKEFLDGFDILWKMLLQIVYQMVRLRTSSKSIFMTMRRNRMRLASSWAEATKHS